MGTVTFTLVFLTQHQHYWENTKNGVAEEIFFFPPKSKDDFFFYSRRVRVGRCEQKACECFTLCWLGSLGHGGPARILFTALSAHEVSLPGLERGKGERRGDKVSSVSRLLSQVASPSWQPRPFDCSLSQGPRTLQPFITTALLPVLTARV